MALTRITGEQIKRETLANGDPGQIQFNTGGELTGSPGLSWVNATESLLVGGASAKGTITAQGNGTTEGGMLNLMNSSNGSAAMTFDGGGSWGCAFSMNSPTGTVISAESGDGVSSTSYLSLFDTSLGQTIRLDGAGTITAFGDITGGNLSGTNTGDQTANDILPDQTGNSGKVLVTDGTNVSWASGGAGGTPGGSDTQIQYNSSGSFAGSSDLAWNNTTKTLTVGSGSDATVNFGRNLTFSSQLLGVDTNNILKNANVTTSGVTGFLRLQGASIPSSSTIIPGYTVSANGGSIQLIDALVDGATLYCGNAQMLGGAATFPAGSLSPPQFNLTQAYATLSGGNTYSAGSFEMYAGTVFTSGTNAYGAAIRILGGNVSSGSVTHGSITFDCPGSFELNLDTGQPGQVFTSNGYGVGPVWASPASASAPASATATGVPGTIAYDSSYVYICVDIDTWKRAALSTW